MDMLLRLIDDVNKALDAECYFSALALALTLPDICGKAEFPQKRNRQRYISWYDEHIGKYEQCPCEQCQKAPMAYLSGKVVYSLRSGLLHQGTPNIDVKEIDYFALVIESKKPFNIYVDEATAAGYRVNVRRLCLILCETARGYHKDNREKFDFFHCSIIDLDSEVKKMHLK